MRTITIFISLLFLSMNAFPQFFEGLSKEDIKREIKTKFKGFYEDNSITNSYYNYAKYVDFRAEQTWLFFLDENDCCVWWKLVCDYIMEDEKREWLDKTYKKVSEDEWIYTSGYISYSIKLIKEKWFFYITCKPK